MWPNIEVIESLKERTEKKLNGQKLSKLDENCKSIDLRSPTKSKHKKHGDNYSKTHHNQIIHKPVIKEKILKATRGGGKPFM